MKATITLIPLLLVSTLLTTAHTADALETDALPAYCALAPDATSNVWTGAVDDNWEESGNWSDPNGFPGSPGGGDPDACIPTGGTPVISGSLGQEGHVRTLDVQSGATITIQPGGKLFMYGDQASDEDSVIRSGGRINDVGGTVGGIAKLHVLGTLTLERDSTGSATVLTRDCAYNTPGGSYPGEDTTCDGTPVEGPTFLMEVGDSGIVDVKGGGLNFGDQTRIVNHGLVRVRSGAYIAADHGTKMELRPRLGSTSGAGTLRFEGDGGYLEGKLEDSTGFATLSTLVNQGLIIKTGGNGRTLVSAVYTQPSPGKVTVRTGTVLLPTTNSTPATVSAGTTYGTGKCVKATAASCGTQTTPDYQQSADIKVPATTTTAGASVVVRKLADPSSTSDLGRPFEVHATSMKATASSPAVIKMRFDSTVLGGKRWADVRVLRMATGATSYRTVKACLSDGTQPTGEVACVDRRKIAGVSSRDIANTSGNPDVLMVIRTRATSRWVGR